MHRVAPAIAFGGRCAHRGAPAIVFGGRCAHREAPAIVFMGRCAHRESARKAFIGQGAPRGISLFDGTVVGAAMMLASTAVARWRVLYLGS